MRITIVTESLVTGGAETFVLRLAWALSQSGHVTTLFVLRGDLVSAPLIGRLAGNLPIVAVRLPWLPWVMKLDGLLYRLGSGFSFLRWMQVNQLRKHLVDEPQDVVHSHLLTADLVTARACNSLGIPWVSTMHGDYLALEAKVSSRAARIPDFDVALREIESSVGHMVCITEQQQSQLSRVLPSLEETGRISKIYNGYAASAADVEDGSVPEALSGIPEGDFVVGMVARGIREKGWDVMIAAFTALDLPDAWLVLVGDGDYLQQIRPSIQNSRIVFCGDVVDPLRYIARFDVGCLPSQIPTESLPTVVIEYMYLGKPVVATAVGEIPRMIDAQSNVPAGLLIDLGQTHAMAEQMQTALKRLYEDKAERSRLSNNAVLAVRKFDMNICVDAYVSLYKRVQR